MKRKILMGLFSFALLIATGYGINKSMQSNVGLTELALTNVEALGQGEVDFPWLCQHTSPKVCIIDMGDMFLGDRIF